MAALALVQSEDAARLRNEQRPRDDFPIFDPAGPNAGLIYLDTGASAQKPRSVIDATTRFYSQGYANIHRGVYRLSQTATDDFEAAREAVRRFIHAARSEEIIFVRGATEAINLVASAWGRAHLKAGDAVVITTLEHHANIVPWQMLRDALGLELLAAPLAADGGLDLDAWTQLIQRPNVKLIAFTHIANATGAVNPVAEMMRRAKTLAPQAATLIDGCQAAPHRPIDVQALGCDFYVFSGHKLYGPTGIGVLYGRYAQLERTPPYQSGGDMIDTVTLETTTFLDPPHRFEAGTPDIAGAIGLKAAIEYVESLGWEWIQAHEADLLAYGQEVLSQFPDVSLAPAGAERCCSLSFTIDGIHPHDLGTIFDMREVCVRAGSHCAQPLLDALGIHATVRASLGVYNERSDLDALAAAIAAARKMFKK